ncbi:hypothetical protein SEA_DOGGS_51 [Gordonia phage Doggs]|nr:hypothetical protein SEA_DOGGS_51 [Gordonia phage Doggs]
MTLECPEVPSGQPTWARLRHGAGCALPRRLEDGSIGILPTTVPVRLVLDRYETAPDGSHREVWVLRAEDWSEGDSVEIGPLAPNVRVEYEIGRLFVARSPAAAADEVPA